MESRRVEESEKKILDSPILRLKQTSTLPYHNKPTGLGMTRATMDRKEIIGKEGMAL